MKENENTHIKHIVKEEIKINAPQTTFRIHKSNPDMRYETTRNN